LSREARSSLVAANWSAAAFVTAAVLEHVRSLIVDLERVLCIEKVEIKALSYNNLL
jgi:hypothetical protein